MQQSPVHIFDTTQALNKALADFILSKANEAVTERGRFIVCLSGGSTPAQLYSLLANEYYCVAIPWQKTFIFWGDERCVPASDERNNAHMARKTLLNHIEIPAGNVYPIQTELAPDNAARAYELKLQDFFENELPVFDLILLGLGEDGHTASLLPGTAVLTEYSRWVSEVYHSQQQMFRVTLTLPVINNARCCVFLVTGSGKAQVVKELLGKNAKSNYPAQLIKPLNGNLVWYLDKPAAQLIN